MRYNKPSYANSNVILRVQVRDNNAEHALRALKKKQQRDGFWKRYKALQFYAKPSEKRVIREQEAYRRAIYNNRKRIERQGY